MTPRSLAFVIGLAVLLGACSTDPPPARPNVAESPPILALPPAYPAQAGYVAPEPVERSGPYNGFAKCASCHRLTPGRHGVGPSLAGVYGRRAGTAPGYRYSAAMSDAGLVWNAATLDRYLARPRDLVPGNKMTFGGLPDPAVRAEVIAFLQRH